MSCFNKTKRLLKKKEFDFVFANAKKIVTPEFVFLYRENNCGFARLGLALSKKKIAKAHDRNRMKRFIRETFRTSDLPAIDVVVIARHGLADADASKIITNLSKAWDRLSALCSK